jgi:signal peptidase I
LRQGERYATTVQAQSEDGMTLVASRTQVSNGPAYALLAELVRKYGTVRLHAVGTSMVPAIHPGDLLSVQRVDVKEILRGDIVVYAREETLIVHRVVKVMATVSPEPYLITRGDRLLRDDPQVLSPELIGRVSLVQRGQRSLGLRPLPSAVQQVLCLALRNSDLATYFYLRVSALCREISYKELTCRA